MNSSNEMVSDFLARDAEVYPGCSVFIHPTNGISIVIWVGTDFSTPAEHGILVDFPIGEVILPNLCECGALARCLSSARRYRVDPEGTLYLSATGEVAVDMDDLDTAFAFLSFHRAKNVSLVSHEGSE